MGASNPGTTLEGTPANNASSTDTSAPNDSRLQGKTGKRTDMLFALNNALAFATLVGLLCGLGWRCFYWMTPDETAYLRIGSYYAQGRFDLVVSGHWCPLISWLVAPLLWIGLDPLIAARIVIGLSSLLFWAGSWVVLRRAGLQRLALAAGAWCMTFAYAEWTAQYVTPDLLAAGVICFAFFCAVGQRLV